MKEEIFELHFEWIALPVSVGLLLLYAVWNMP